MKTNLKVVFVGDLNVGKTSFLITLSNNCYPAEYIPTINDFSELQVIYEGKTYYIMPWDTAAQDDYERLRPLCYPQTDVFVFCFSFKRFQSLKNIQNKWYPEVTSHCGKKIKSVLVGLCYDEVNNNYINQTDISSLMESINCFDYLEISSKDDYNVQELLPLIVKAFKRESDSKLDSKLNQTKEFCKII